MLQSMARVVHRFDRGEHLQALALLGADVVLTDVASVLPLLQRNVEENISKPSLRRESRGLLRCARAAAVAQAATEQ